MAADSTLRRPAADQTLVDFAISIAREAGELTLGWFETPGLDVVQKTDGSPVTVADREAESLLRDRITVAHPDDSIIGEEGDDRSGSSGRTWILDPIDGTESFIRGVPLYGTLVALVDEHGPAVGVVNLPALDECIWAGRGRGCFANGQPAQVSERTNLS
ncbi:MAG: inositol monophosphatase family protein, partial [Actinomycetota bacterium]|nr:inositol monophosphatase family protein [Actinomycetota bacterium]